MFKTKWMRRTTPYFQPKELTPPSHTLILTHWPLSSGLVQAYTLPYVDIIRSLLPESSCLYLVTSEIAANIRTDESYLHYRLSLSKRGISVVSFKYYRAGLRKYISLVGDIIGLVYLIKANQITRIHSFCTPAGSLGVLLSLICGVQLIVDSFEPHAESMLENKTWTKASLVYKVLSFLEFAQARFAKTLIFTTSGMNQYCRNRFNYIPFNTFVKPACVDLAKFKPENLSQDLRSSLGLDDKVVCVYAGKIGGIYLDVEIFQIIKVFHKILGDRFRFLLLSDCTSELLANYLRDSGLPDDLVVHRNLPHSEVSQYLSLASFALNPVRPVPTKRYCTSIKDGEYWASGLPVIITKNISDDSDIIHNNNIGYVLNSLDEREYFNAAYHMLDLIKSTPELKDRIREIAANYRSFSIAKHIYSSIYA